jgi:hypothetical protein
VKKIRLYWNDGQRLVADDQVDITGHVGLAIQFLYIVGVAVFSASCLVCAAQGHSVILVDAVLVMLGIASAAVAACWEVWAATFFGAGFGRLAGWAHVLVATLVFYCIFVIAHPYLRDGLRPF